MYTVIILNKHTSDLLKDFRFLFKPFIDQGIISFCDWNEYGTDLQSSVPDLYNLIKGKQEWRALVIGTDSMSEQTSKFCSDDKNPFDFPQENCSNAVPKESDIPVIRLSHMLCGYPVSTVKNFEKGYEYFDENIGKITRVRESELSEEEICRLSEKYGEYLKSIYMEEYVPEDIKQEQKRLVDKYTFMDTRPREVLFISTRKHRMDEDTIYDSWKTQFEMASSNFCERNRYPSNCRFMCYSITNAENSKYMKELVEFWLSILTVAINKIPASSLQAYRLYRLSIEISQKEMSELLNSHLDKMEAVYQFIQDRLKMRAEYSFDMKEDLVERQEIPVILEEASGKSLFINTRTVGLSNNCPCNEMDFWIKEVWRKQKNIDSYLKEPRRAVDRAAQYMKHKAESFYGDEYELDRFQVADLLEEMERLEAEILACDTRGIIDDQKIKAELRKADKKVRKDISERMRKSTVISMGILVLLVYVIGFIPYVYNSAMLGRKEFLASMLVMVAASVVVATGGMIALLVLRHRIIESMDSFNSVVRDMVNNVNSIARRFGEYFSAVCSYMKAQSVYMGIRLKSDSMSSTRFLLRVHKQALRVSIERNEEFAASYGIKRQAQALRDVTTFFDENKLPKDNKLYYFEPSRMQDDIPLNETGDYVVTPYKFVAKLRIERENIYEDAKGDS